MSISYKCLIVVLMVLFFCLPPGAATSSDYGIPPELENWKAWVLYHEEENQCPCLYNDGEHLRCSWPSRLDLAVEADRGRFVQDWQVLAESWIPLPGSREQWPEDVRANGQVVCVVERGQSPYVRLSPGKVRLEGLFAWPEMPETIRIPPASGLLSLTINQKNVEFPVLDASGRLWLQKRTDNQAQEDRVEVRIFRLLTDSIPMTVLTVVKMDVSGRAREISLDGVMPDGSIPVSLDSELPARLGTGGKLKIQVRPGRWDFSIRSRYQGPMDEIGPVEPAYGPETWSFVPQNNLRLVKVEGVTAVDPGQTDIPDDWKNYSTYAIQSGSRMIFKTIRRGDPDPAPDRLNLERTWWLDFDGRGFTIQDRITGTLSRQWSLFMNSPIALGRVSVDDRDQLITQQGPEERPGVELRLGRLNLTADSRLEENKGLLPAVGWDHDFQSVSEKLNLPPGWRLLTASGVDLLPGTWFQRWTLLDFFLVLIITIVVFKFSRWRWGLLTLATLILIFQEPGAPRVVFLSLLAATALLRVLPEGWFKKITRLWRIGSIVTLLAISVPFMVNQARIGVYPQLEEPVSMEFFWPGGGQLSADLEDRSVNAPVPAARMETLRSEAPSKSSLGLAKRKQEYYQEKSASLTQDPNALIQTGPGLPTWNWRSLSLRWNGPVQRDQMIDLWLISPHVNLVLCLLRVLLLAVLIYGLVDFRKWWGRLDKRPVSASAAVLVMLTVMSWPAGAQDRVQQQAVNQSPESAMVLPAVNGPGQPFERLFPGPGLLGELKDRLLAKPECLPNCAHFSRMDLTARPEALTIRLELHALSQVAVPLPGIRNSWTPDRVLLDDQPAEALFRDKEGILWLLAPEGVHQVVLEGLVPKTAGFQFPLPLKPSRAVFSSEGWEVRGINPEGQVEANIQLTRLKQKNSQTPIEEDGRIPPFLRVKRVISLGLDWRVTTTVTRLGPRDASVVTSIPLLPGESVTTAGIRVQDGQALVNMDPKAEEISWVSALGISPEINLESPRGRPWTEVWILEAAPIWHCELSGIPVIHNQDEQGKWSPEWRPWPGETVTVKVSRPKALPGQTVTIDRAALEWTPGERFNKAALTLLIRASQGGQHRVVLPEGARLQLVRIKGKSQPIGQEKGEVSIPLTPESQEVYIEWHDRAGSALMMRGPRVIIGREAVNAQVSFNMPSNRWILLTGGPLLGPAVRFWSYLLVVILAAVGLGRVGRLGRRTPLRTRHWLLLGLGLTQVHPLMAIFIIGWLLILNARKDYDPPEGWFFFDLGQIVLVIWTVVALYGLYTAIEEGLLGIPQMQIAGNNSSSFFLNWTQDRIGPEMPQPWVLSLPRLVYHFLMLAWALWLALSLVKWLRWGWEAFGVKGMWRKPRIRRGPDKKPEEEFLIE